MLQFDTLEDRFNYLKVGAFVGDKTFGSDRWLNQDFYRSRDWKRVRDIVIMRDEGRDLAVVGHEIYDRIYIHHMNPITAEEIESGDPDILNPEYLVSTTHDTHNAIHFGNDATLPRLIVQRRPGDTRLWSPIRSIND